MSAVFNTAFLNVGLSGDFGWTRTLTRIVGTAHAREAYLLAERFGADDAARIGLVSKVVPDEHLMDEVRATAERLAASPPIALRRIKANLNDALEIDFAQALDREATRHYGAVALLTRSKQRTPFSRSALRPLGVPDDERLGRS
jgi:2-(1,2-epoxy-1,2-dihydrophenyl)acetyl-CoA isomerase